ncbi:MAG: hypothetical protein E7478_00120 [Ruminococcaceae bacterium]|nr:hypothetical protein [Oscillospiraceae bacterium]
MRKNAIGYFGVVVAVVICFPGCAGETASTSEQSEYGYAVISQSVELGNSRYAQIDVYYDDTSGDEYAHYKGSHPYVVIKQNRTGRICATSKIPTSMVSERSVAAPESAELKCFDVDGNTILAVMIPLSEEYCEPHFFHYVGDDQYGMHRCTAMFGMSFESDSLDWASLTVEDGGLSDALGNRFEFDFSDYPTSVSLNCK